MPQSTFKGTNFSELADIHLAKQDRARQDELQSLALRRDDEDRQFRRMSADRTYKLAAQNAGISAQQAQQEAITATLKDIQGLDLPTAEAGRAAFVARLGQFVGDPQHAQEIAQQLPDPFFQPGREKEISKIVETEGGGLGLASSTKPFREFDLGGKRIASKPSTTVNVGDAGAPTFAKELAKSSVKEFGEFQAASHDAEDALNQIQVARDIDVTTGSGESYLLAAREIGDMLGFPVDDRKIQTAQAFNAVMGRLVNDRVTKEKGAQTDSDIKRVKATFAQLDNPPQAKDFLLSYMETLELRKIERADFYREWYSNTEDSNNLNVTKAWKQHMRENPIFSERVTNPENGLPTFYTDFVRIMREANPAATDQQIAAKWREKTRG